MNKWMAAPKRDKYGFQYDPYGNITKNISVYAADWDLVPFNKLAGEISPENANLRWFKYKRDPNLWRFLLSNYHGDKCTGLELGGAIDIPLIRPNLNINTGPAVDYVWDLHYGMPFKDCSFGVMFSKFVLEHINHRRLNYVITEIHRTLVTGGSIISIVPNLLNVFKKLSKSTNWYPDVAYEVFGGNPDSPGNFHRTGFSPDSAVDIFKGVGFSEVVVWDYPVFDMEMIIEAWK